MTVQRLGLSPGPATPTTRNGEPLPVYVRAIAIVGIPGVIAIGLTWVLATKLPERLDAHAEETRQLISTLGKEANDRDSQLFQLLRRICLNTATTAEERAECWRVQP